jgi:hypothetical protein
VEYFNRTAFIISDQKFIAEILSNRLAIFHIFLIGEHQVQHQNITVCKAGSFHDTAVMICQGMLQRQLGNIVSDTPNQLLQQKVLELIKGSSDFALNGGIQNALDNLWHNVPFLPGSRSIDSMHDRYIGTPAIIIASGPSLLKNVHLLQDLKSRAILISCGSALVPLCRRKIVPHFEVVVDPNKAMYAALKPYLGVKTCFVLSLMAQHKISEECTAERMYFLVNFGPKAVKDIRRFTNIKTLLPAMASVATTALFFALHAGCDPIVFVGQDLCYQDGRTHIDAVGVSKNACVMETVDGRRVQSSPALKEAFDFYSGFIPTIHDRKIINATEGGAGIHGAEHMSLESAAERFMQRVISTQELPALAVADRQCEARLNELRNQFNAMYVKAAGFHRKIRKQFESGKDNAALSAKITAWFESLRMMPGYEYLENYLDWAYYRADITDTLAPKLDWISAITRILQQQIKGLNPSLS